MKDKKEQLRLWGIPHKDVEKYSKRGDRKFLDFYFEIEAKNSLTIGYSSEDGKEISELESELQDVASNFGLTLVDAVQWAENALGEHPPVVGFTFAAYDNPLTVIKQDSITKHLKKLIERYGASCMIMTDPTGTQKAA